MLPVRIEGATRVLGAPRDWNPEDNGPCCGLAIRDEVTDGLPYMTSAWEPMPADIAAINAGGRIMLRIVGTGHPPVALWVEARDAQGIEAAAADETRSGSAVGESPVPKECAQTTTEYAQTPAPNRDTSE